MKKFLCGVLSAVLLLTSLSGCSWLLEDEEPTVVTNTGSSSWLIYWYLCGSDLESEGGYATEDLQELMEVSLPEDVTVLIQTGGASEWYNDYIDPSVLQRYEYSSEGLNLVDEQSLANMGAADTLADFLRYGQENYSADKTAVVFWNHGGGTVSGVSSDELFDGDTLTLAELSEAFGSVFTASTENPPLELVGFDTCLMATVDTAATFSGLASYLVASEETEPANGWYYSQWVGRLAQNTDITGAELGQIICDTYYEGCVEQDTEDEATLSVTDLSKVPALLTAYEALGAECLKTACEDSSFLSTFARAADSSENYGGNTREQGYTNMVDLGDLAEHANLSASEQVSAALSDCVVYTVNGAYRSEAEGLSCYYSYNGDLEDLEGYLEYGTGQAFKYYYQYVLTGSLDADGMAYLQSLSGESSSLPAVQNISGTNWEDIAITVDESGTATMTLGPQANELLSSVTFQLCYVDTDSDTMMLLGTDNDINADWKNGVFSDNFRGVWGSIDGCLVYMELNYEGDSYNLYSVPVLLNGEEYNLQVVYDFSAQAWEILGAWQGIDEYGMGEKELYILQPGDEITTLWMLASYSGDDDFEAYEADTITYSDQTEFYETELFDGIFYMLFEMTDVSANTAYSDTVGFEVSDGKIYTLLE